jgi:hypothetical protein
MDTARYYLATLVVGLAALGVHLGGLWAWVGIATLPVLTVLDAILPPDYRMRSVKSESLTNLPLYLHVPLMVGLWACFLDQLRQWHEGTVTLSWPVLLGMVLSVGWLGAVPNVPITHEMMHRRHWLPRALSKLLNTFYLDPNRDVGHKLTHHIELCTPADSDTPTRGQTIYSFMWQATYGAWRDGVMTSLMALRKRDLSFFHPRNALYVEFGLLGVLVGVTWAAAGWPGLAVAAATAVLSKLFTEGVNYLQHYGMVRVPGAPIRIHHAWNHLGRIMRPLGMEITNHLEHHFDSQYKFYELKPRPDAPQMPSAFLCFLVALIPPVWEKTIAMPRLRHWDIDYASEAEQKLAMEQNARAGWPIWVEMAGAVSPNVA